ncbi:hypothetical protein EMIHUDRAFT_107658 [Emiliania huxleyi CCMP1516]|uniref:Uncharacterized protein n=2 Tax=Emiliania huxleyi TaxID=2903 RepID=A0A0D3HZQ8_EMIH1|nr:hypothetical protein EMIHUDRAFT_107658 [Emiliania huxleyi CCMP1516]EOD04493.1 hypothetical protein EMIHUDRAFT_107658 [Emiliania huxleyi CCMP1516]|eukprot:XP_005756922.1 hypothetical protein EMIHUDRAFT_107658 [Emiliania huxleyi CCMP1516]
MAAPSDALSSTLSAALEQVSVGSAGSTVAATTTITALVDPATAARENETLLSALELSAASSLEHVLAREVAVSCGLAAGAGGVHGGGGSSGGVVDVPRLQEVLRQAEASIQATPHAWVNVTAASRIFDIGRSRVTAALGAAATVQRELERLAPPPSSSAGPHTAERQQRGSFSSAAAAAAEAAEAAAAAALASVDGQWALGARCERRRESDGAAPHPALLGHAERAVDSARCAVAASSAASDGAAAAARRAVAEAVAERDATRAEAAEAQAALRAEVRRLTELVEGYQRRIGERQT